MMWNGGAGGSADGRYDDGGEAESGADGGGVGLTRRWWRCGQADSGGADGVGTGGGADDS